MEEFEDLVPQPDEDGRLELTYRAWREVEDVVWTMARTLIFLDVSFNSITFLPEELGDLYQLKLFNCSCNQIDALPPTLGRLIKLQTLKANGNHICIIPPSIGKCKALKTIHLSENKVIDVPATISSCTRLEVLRLQNNALQKLPHELGSLTNIREIDVSNNPSLEMIPKPMRGNSAINLWIIGLHHKNNLKVREVEETNKEMFQLINESADGIKGVHKMTKQISDRRTELLLERASVGTFLQLKELRRQCTIM